MLDDVEIDDLERTDGFSSACGEYFLGKLSEIDKFIFFDYFILNLINFIIFDVNKLVEVNASRLDIDYTFGLDDVFVRQ